MTSGALYEGEYLRLLRRGHWEYVERTNSNGVAVIVAVTDADELLLVEQYREPVARRVIELPAGLVGDLSADESLIEAAGRELLEETGYAARDIEIACTGPVTAGLSNEVTTFCIARELERTGPGGGDASEDITVHEVPLAEVDAWLAARPRDVAVDPKIHAGLWLLTRDVSKPSEVEVASAVSAPLSLKELQRRTHELGTPGESAKLIRRDRDTGHGK